MELADSLKNLAVDMADLGFEHRARALADACRGNAGAVAAASAALRTEAWQGSRQEVASAYLDAAYEMLTAGGDRFAQTA